MISLAITGVVAVVDGREVRSQLLSLLSDALFGSPDTKRYRVTHRTEYRYSDIVTSSYGRGFLTPRDSLRQRCVTHQITIDPTPADSSTSRDTYGNISSYFHVTEPHRVLGITSDSIVDVAPPDSGLYTSGPALLPWEAARPSGMQGALAVDFALDLDPAEITDEVREYAAVSFLPERPLVEALRDLTTRIYNDFTYRSGSTTVSTRVNEVLQAREGVCQDFARLAIACLRANGLAACYVSGYLATDPPPGKDRMIGIDATHAWAAVWTPQQPGQFEWMGLDPTNDQLVDERYIVVGRGRDYADVPPVRGIIYTNSEHSVIDVGVDVVPFEGDVLDA
ncbi:Protein containing transglutaminase-like domain, putative cysteine protease [Mycobacterium marinum MB2]|nr:Protein containing transglutaminase-like domain, putative cysteine protease [Mycobacterium marinum MB2]MBC9864853.1 Protein containing transglutaminase-like domain, putative cysteine protease [Mycobacterium pseudoshottsii]